LNKRHQRQHRVIDLLIFRRKGALALKASQARRANLSFSSTTMRSAVFLPTPKFATAT